MANQTMESKIISEDVKRIATSLESDVLELQGKTILISGGAGFLGRYFLYFFDYLNSSVFNKACKVICVDNFITSTNDKLKRQFPSKTFSFITHDVSQKLNLRRKIDYVIHAAGIASPVYYRKYPLEAIEVNTQGTKNFLDLAKKNRANSFLYFSSSEIYGDPDAKHIPTSETYRGNVSSIGPRACYDESKRLGEALCVNYQLVHKVPVKIVRPFNIYGPGMRPTDYRVIPTFLYNALQGKPLPVHDTGKQTRTYCYISDALIALLKVLLKGANGEVYNVGNDKPEITTYKLAKLIQKIYSKNVKIRLLPYPANYPTDVPQRRCPDITKICKKLHFKPKIDLPTGLERSMEWYKELQKYKNDI